jgi:hypothetical protein
MWESKIQSTKSELRNPKQIQIIKIENPKPESDLLEFWSFGYWDLFDVSCFVFQIFLFRALSLT